MTLAEISDASQAIAAIAVVASLVILILQNQQANALARNESRRHQMEGVQNISRVLFETPGLADVWVRGNSDFQRLSSEDRVKFMAFVTYTHRIWEALHQEYQRGRLDEGLWRAHTQMLRDVQALSGVKRAWSIRQHIFSEDFQRFYEANADTGIAQDLFGLKTRNEEQPSKGQVQV
jgi:hypothetical protein